MPFSRRVPARSNLLDGLALTASFLCLLHCLALPLLLALMPAALHFLHGPESVHALVVGIALPVSIGATLSGHRLHGKRLPLILVAIGLAALLVGAVAEVWLLVETGATVAGSLLLGAGHLINWRRRSHALLLASG